jgi:hypothetical protein
LRSNSDTYRRPIVAAQGDGIDAAKISRACSRITLVGPLNCNAAVATAEHALPSNHPPIVSMEFHYGRYTGLAGGCIVQPDEGYVIFKTGDTSNDLWITVKAGESGQVVLTGTVGHYPPPDVCQPSH